MNHSVSMVLGWWLVLLGHETFHLDRWEPPVFFGTRPLLHQNKLFIADNTDQKVKVYDAANGLEDPKFLWETPGGGNGPGEIPKGSYFNHLAIHPETEQLWVSHRTGFSIFDKSGRFLRQIKMTHNQSWLILQGNNITMTSRDFLEQRTLLTRVALGQRDPTWEIPSIKGIPTTANGGFLEEVNELYLVDDQIVTYCASLGQLAIVNQEGNILLLLDLPQTLPEYLQPVEYSEALEHGGSFRLYPLHFSYSGIAKRGTQLLALTQHYCGGIRTTEKKYAQEKADRGYRPLKILNAIDAETGEIKGKYFHPSFLDQVYLVALDNEVLTFFNLETGDEMYRIPWAEFEPVKDLIF